MAPPPYELHFAIVDNHASDAIDIAERGLYDHAAEVGHPAEELTLHVVVHDAAGAVVGACGGPVMWDVLHIDLMWVRPELRGQGIGEELLRRAETEARRRGYFRIHLDTMSFQAPDFYPRLGYTAFAHFEGYPQSASRTFFVKELTP